MVGEAENDHLQGRDNSPKTLVAVYNTILHHKEGVNQVAQDMRSESRPEMTFLNAGDEGQEGDKIQAMLATQGRTRPAGSTPAQEGRRSNIRCYNCGCLGHYANEPVEENDVEGNSLEKEKDKCKERKSPATHSCLCMDPVEGSRTTMTSMTRALCLRQSQREPRMTPQRHCKGWTPALLLTCGL